MKESHTLISLETFIVNLCFCYCCRFYRRFVAFVVYFVMFVIAFALRPAHDPCESENETESMSTCSQEDSENSTLNPCYLLQPYRDEDIVSDYLKLLRGNKIVGEGWTIRNKADVNLFLILWIMCFYVLNILFCSRLLSS